MNDDVIFHIQEYISDFDFLYNISLINTGFCLKKRRKNIQDINNSMHLLKTFINTDIQYINDFLSINSFSETIQWYSNVLLNTIPIEKYEYNQLRIYNYTVNKFASSYRYNSQIFIRYYPVKLHNIYRCLPLTYYKIKKSLTLKALIY
tara:strand:+ start:39990 stop:40433 length:444 start_codon:yes stop_codon:yes gene_type:complete